MNAFRFFTSKQRFNSKVKIALSVVVAALATMTSLLAGCRNETPTVPGEMRQAYGTTQELFSYVWSEQSFSNPKNHARILKLLSALNQNFHTVDNVSGHYKTDPGFEIALFSIETMLDDSLRRFEAGQTEYARWRLQALVENCISCHSRYQISDDFIGNEPMMEDSSLDSSFARADYLLATRQFDKASESYLALARRLSHSSAGSLSMLRALEHWLLIELRVKNRPAYAADKLSEFLGQSSIQDSSLDIINAWINDLRKIEQQKPPALGLFHEAKNLLAGLPIERIFDEDNRRVVRTLRATTILHMYLQGVRQESEQRQAVCLLGEAYYHLPIRSLEPFADSYLEYCITHFPDTDDARRAFALYDNYIEEQSSGSGGIFIDEEDLAKLKKLKQLAFGSNEQEARLDKTRKKQTVEK